MSETIKKVWLKDNDNKRISPNVLINQIFNEDGTRAVIPSTESVISINQINKANGVAGLDANGLIPSSILPVDFTLLTTDETQALFDQYWKED